MSKMREALKLAEGRLELLLAASLPESDHPTATEYVLAQVRAALAAEQEDGWRPLDQNADKSAAPFDGQPVLIFTNHTWCNQVHRAIWTDQIHGNGIFGWAVEDCKFGPYPLRGYTVVTHWRPLPPSPIQKDGQ